ncbi:hypothetical protein HPB47_002012 [Ixodes persulcatus]|uniref:Uncharacterized protein n=1 Tax=Ixodes persulcatus TaxID=34615 RepID=A0AC60PP83_IXOPE|nr:hypothetical protein HPB47_002012 [Ixodes persulcatus]
MVDSSQGKVQQSSTTSAKERGGNSGDYEETVVDVSTGVTVKRTLEPAETGESADEDEPGLSDSRPNYPTVKSRRSCIAVKPHVPPEGRLRHSPK